MTGLMHLFVLMATVAVTVTGRPQQRCLLNDYEKAVLARYFPAVAEPELQGGALEPAVMLDYEGSESLRAGRSNDRGGTPGREETDVADVDPLLHAASPVGHYYGYAEHVPAARSTTPPACKTADANARNADAKSGGGRNDTAAATVSTAAAATMPTAAAVEKLTAYYEQLKAQQETLARQQLQQQLYEQQQRRQQQFMLAQQQIQQQYYQQQQHAMLMFDQLRKNPAFVNQLAAFVDHKHADLTKATGNKATAALPSVPVAAVVPLTPNVALPASSVALPAPSVALPAPNVVLPAPVGVEDKKRGDKERKVGNDLDADKDSSKDACALKRVETRQTASESQSAPEDEQNEYDDEQSPPVLEKVYSSISE